ncbi:MAG: hypothetical protein PHE59_00060 [Patescibacteria group bacterium]|nr:hypothetical protein [Patescibacteria group bacterium]MDD5164555.1 hypothetical protein [Patescibacteria group bacterium]MDD5534320.1 hypothetical protein [Patescibacteria group bacterium]
MKITKSIQKIKGNSVDFLGQLEKIIECILVIVKIKFQDAQISLFRLTLSLPYKDISYETYNEFKNNWRDIDFSLLDYFVCSIHIQEGPKLYKNIFDFGSTFFKHNQFVELSIGADEQDFLEKLFYKVTQSLPEFKILEYVPESDQIKERKNIILKTILILKKFNRYQLRLKNLLKNEKELQNFLFPILKSHFLNLEEELNLPKFGTISYKPDFGIPDAKLLLECKYLRKKQDIKKIQKEINDDAAGYLVTSTDYKSLIIFIYNEKNTPIPDKFSKDLKKISGIIDVIIVPGVDPK